MGWRGVAWRGGSLLEGGEGREEGRGKGAVRKQSLRRLSACSLEIVMGIN